MSEQAARDEAAKVESSVLEPSVRALSEFVIRAAVLPVTLLFTPPSAILRSTQTGDYRPLPPPFVLALVAGVVVSGLTSNLGKLDEGDDSAAAYANFLTAATEFYSNADGISALLFALPFLGMVWLFAGCTSFLMGHMLRSASPLFAVYALCMAAIIEVSAIAFAVAVFWAVPLSAFGPYVKYGLMLIGFVYALQGVRLVFEMRHGAVGSWVGAAMASLVALCAIGALGVAGGALTGGLLQGERNLQRLAAEEQAIVAQMTLEQTAQTRLSQCEIQEVENDLIGAAPACDAALQLRPDWPEALIARGRVHLRRGELFAAYADYDAAVQLSPLDPAALRGRGFVSLRRGAFAAAYADYDAAVALSPDDPDARYGRGLAHLGLGRNAEGEADIAAAVALNRYIESEFTRGVEPE